MAKAKRDFHQKIRSKAHVKSRSGSGSKTAQESFDPAQLLRDRVSKRGVMVLGDVAIDRYVFGDVDRISPEAPVPVLHQTRVENRLGCAANVIENLVAMQSAWDMPLSILSVTGDDGDGSWVGSAWKKSTQVQTELLKDPSRPTIVKTRLVAGAHHQLVRLDQESRAPISEKFQKELLKRVLGHLKHTRVLIVQDYSKGLLSAELLAEVVRVAKREKVLVFVDPNRNTPCEWYRGVDLITPNVAEAEVILKRDLGKGRDHEVVARAAYDMMDQLDLGAVLLTRSQYGMTLVDRENGVRHFAARARQVFDVSGAGDTTVAVLAGAVAVAGAGVGAHGNVWDQRVWDSACILASAAAGVVVSKMGTATASPSEILAELESQS